MLDVTSLLRMYTLRRKSSLSSSSPSLVHEKTLLSLIRSARRTRFAKDHNFSRIKSVRDYQQAVPLRSYEQFWNDYWKASFPILDDVSWPGRIPFFAVSSGTSSGTTKYIPCSHEMVRSNTKAGVDLLVHHLTNRPASRILGGLNFMLGGSTDLTEEAKNVWSGDLSGIAARTIPAWIRPRYFPPPDLALIADWRQKIDRLAEEALTRDIRMIAGVPSWLLIFFDNILSRRPGQKLADLFPNLEMIVHGGVRFDPYRARFASLLVGSSAELREVYPASEGFVAVADGPPGTGLRLNLDHGIFFEFVPVDELRSGNHHRHWIGSVELGVEYAIVITSCAGLWSYILGDTVRFVELSPPRIIITGRTSYFLSDFGEHLTGEEIDGAISDAAYAVGGSVTDYAVSSVFPEGAGELGGHRFFVELRGAGEPALFPTAEHKQCFIQTLDSELQRRNDDYRAHRADGFGLKPPTIRFLPAGSFERWMESRGKLGGQHKVPRILPKGEIGDSIVSFFNHLPDETIP